MQNGSLLCNLAKAVQNSKQFYMQRYRSGDVCDRRRWRMKGAKRSGSGRNFCEANSERKISGTLAGHNGADSKGSRAHHSATLESSRFLAISRKCFIFLEFWMNAFPHRPCKSRAKFKHNQIRRDIEVVITGLTRNQFALTRTRVRIPLSPPKRPQFSRIAVFFIHALVRLVYRRRIWFYKMKNAILK